MPCSLFGYDENTMHRSSMLPNGLTSPPGCMPNRALILNPAVVWLARQPLRPSKADLWLPLVCGDICKLPGPAMTLPISDVPVFEGRISELLVIFHDLGVQLLQIPPHIWVGVAEGCQKYIKMILIDRKRRKKPSGAVLLFRVRPSQLGLVPTLLTPGGRQRRFLNAVAVGICSLLAY